MRIKKFIFLTDKNHHTHTKLTTIMFREILAPETENVSGRAPSAQKCFDQFPKFTCENFFAYEI